MHSKSFPVQVDGRFIINGAKVKSDYTGEFFFNVSK